jgi:RNA polymerase-binding transcription factor
MKRNEFLKETQRRLIGRRDALRRALAGDMSMLNTQHEQSSGDEIDAAIATEQAELRSQMASFESRELAQIESALDKIRGGRYGRCETCDRAIAPMRLKALPYATECIDCARRDERRGAVSARSSPINRIAAFRGEDESESSPDEAYEGIR